MSFEFRLKQAHRTQPDISREDFPNQLGLGLVDDQLAILDVVPERNGAAHPHPLSLRRRNLVAYPLACDFALELREREQHVEREPPHGCRRVELLCDRNERGSARVQHIDDLGEIRQ